MYRQGDLLIVRAKNWPGGLIPVENNVVELGEATGHAHVLEHGGGVLPLTPDHAFETMSMETRRRVMEAVGVEAFMAAMGSELVDSDDSGDSLVRIRDEVYLRLHDASTDRQYLLCVPSGMQRVRQAKAHEPLPVRQETNA